MVFLPRTPLRTGKRPVWISKQDKRGQHKWFIRGIKKNKEVKHPCQRKFNLHLKLSKSVLRVLSSVSKQGKENGIDPHFEAA